MYLNEAELEDGVLRVTAMEGEAEGGLYTTVL